jgi:hypothetical protein
VAVWFSYLKLLKLAISYAHAQSKILGPMYLLFSLGNFRYAVNPAVTSGELTLALPGSSKTLTRFFKTQLSEPDSTADLNARNK